MTQREARANWIAVCEMAHEKGVRFKPIHTDWTVERIVHHTPELYRRVTGHYPALSKEQAWDIPGACDRK